MDYRRQKQIIIGLASAAAALGFVFIAVILFTDMKLPEGGLTGGGAREPAFSDPEVVFREFFQAPNENAVDAVALIKNPNSQYGASSISYEFVFYNDDNVPIKTVSGRAFTLPGRSRYIIEPAIRVDAARMDFRMGDIEWRLLAPFSPRGLASSDISLAASGEQSIISGIVNNGSPYNLKNVEAHVVVYEGGRAIAAGRTDMQDLLRGTQRAFQIVLPRAVAQGSETDVRVESNFFENSNFIRDYAR